MRYQIWIGATNEGRLVIGSKNMRGKDIVSREQVYGSQLPHRVVARISDEPNPGAEYSIMTPTDAWRAGYQVSDWGKVPAYRRW